MKQTIYYHIHHCLIVGSILLGQVAIADDTTTTKRKKEVAVIKYNIAPENPHTKQPKPAPLPTTGQGGFALQTADGSKRIEGIEQQTVDELMNLDHHKNHRLTTPKTANPLPNPSHHQPSVSATHGVGPARRRNTPNQFPAQPPREIQADPAICSPKSASVGIIHFKYAEPPASELVWSGFGSKNEEKYKIHRDAKDALHTLVNAAKTNGIVLKPSSIFRSVKRQQQIINHKLSTQSPHEVYRASSPAGYSEHHTGFAVDFGSIDESFTTTRAYEWLLTHGHHYGWEQTFTTDYSAYSGVSEESWHWRYVGNNHEFAHLFHHSKQRAC